MRPIFATLRSLSRSLSYGTRVRPARDWFVLLSLFTLILVGSVIWNLLQFSRVIGGQQIGSSSVATSSPIRLDTVQALFTQRTQERAKYQGQYRFVDPSL
jgi:hypothetical protein